MQENAKRRQRLEAEGGSAGAGEPHRRGRFGGFKFLALRGARGTS
jgi:hypothetical protein